MFFRASWFRAPEMAVVPEHGLPRAVGLYDAHVARVFSNDAQGHRQALFRELVGHLFPKSDGWDDGAWEQEETILPKCAWVDASDAATLVFDPTRIPLDDDLTNELRAATKLFFDYGMTAQGRLRIDLSALTWSGVWKLMTRCDDACTRSGILVFASIPCKVVSVHVVRPRSMMGFSSLLRAALGVTSDKIRSRVRLA